MFDETSCFDPSSSVPDGESCDFSLTVPNCSSMEELEAFSSPTMDDSNNYLSLMQQAIQDSKNQILSCEYQSNWDQNMLQEMEYYHQLDQTLPQTVHAQNDQQVFGTFSPTPDLLNLLPGSTISLPNSAQNSTSISPVLYDLPPQPASLFKEYLQSLPSGYIWPASAGVSLYEVGDEREGGNRKQLANGGFEFSGEIACSGKGRKGKSTKHFTSERDRRIHLNGKFSILKSLVPNPAKVVLLLFKI